MQSITKINIILVAVITSIVLILFFVNDTNTETSPGIVSLSINSVSEIEINRKVAEPILLKKHDNAWYMDKPFNTPVEQFKIDSLLFLLQEQAANEYSIEGKELTQFSLNPARATIRYDDLIIEFGGQMQLDGIQYRYVKIQDRLLVIEDKFYYLVNSLSSDYVEHKIIPQQAIIKKLSLPDLTVTVTDNHYQVEPLPGDFAEDDAVTLVDNWQIANAMSIQPIQPHKVIRTVNIAIEGQEKPIEFSIVESTSRFILARADYGVQYEFKKEAEELLLKLPVYE